MTGSRSSGRAAAAPARQWVGTLAAAALLGGLLGSSACGRPPRDPFVTYFNGDYLLSVRYPASWKTDQADQDGMWYRYFLGPLTGPERKPAVSVTLLAGPLDRPVEEYAEKSYLAGNTVKAAVVEARGLLSGKSWQFDSADGHTRSWLLLLDVPASASGPRRVVGLYAQGEPALFEQHRAALEEMFLSLTPERLAEYVRVREAKWGLEVRVPPTWKETRKLSSKDSLLLQYSSPPLGAEKGQTIHASLSLTVEPAPAGVDAFYQAVRTRLGDAFLVLEHKPWRGGYADSLRTETPVSTARARRYYRVGDGKGYTVACEARDDVFHRVSRWCDLIASTLAVGPEVTK